MFVMLNKLNSLIYLIQLRLEYSEDNYQNGEIKDSFLSSRMFIFSWFLNSAVKTVMAIWFAAVHKCEVNIFTRYNNGLCLEIENKIGVEVNKKCLIFEMKNLNVKRRVIFINNFLI